MGGSPGNHPLPPPPPDGGDKGGTTKPATAGCGEVESQPMGARRKGCHRALGTPNLTHTPPSRSVPYQSNFLSYDLKCPGPKHPIPPTGSEATNIGSALSQDPSRGRVGSAAPHPSPLTVPTHPARSLPGRCSADIRAGRPAGGGGGRGEGACGRGSKGTLGKWAEERDCKAHLTRQLFAPVDTRSREGFDPRHNPPMGGCRRGTRDPGVPLLWGRRERAAQHTSLWGQEV